MPNYIDIYVLPVPRAKLDDYRKLAELGKTVWQEHGALDYYEIIADDVQPGKWTSFPQAVELKDDEVVVVGWVTFKSREDRDRVNKAVFADPRMGMNDMKDAPFDGRRMFWGGFKPLVV